MFVPKSEDTVKVYEQQHAIQKNSELGTYYITREYFDDKMSGFEVLPEEYSEWAMTVVGMANMGEKLFPEEVVFSLVDGQYYVDIL